MALTGIAMTRVERRPLGRVDASWRLVDRNYRAYIRNWIFFATGFFEPVLYLFSIGVGVGKLIESFEVNGQPIPYAAFVAPGMLAASAMNGAIMDSTFNIFFKLKFEKLYDSILATPMRVGDVARGEIIWCLIRGGLYSAGFMLVMLAMGLIGSWWAVLALPAALLLGYAFAGVGMALTTFMRSWQDFEFIQLAIMPMFLFSATFFPLSTYPAALQWLVSATPLYQGVALERALVLGEVGWGLLWHVAYLVVLGALGVWGTARRIATLLLT
jgi:lipooligosaccharide transport system permease protein